VVWAQEEPRNNGYWSFVEPFIEQCLVEAGVRRSGRSMPAARRRPRRPRGLPSGTNRNRLALIEQALGLGGQAEPQRKAS
jgi:2-oxoglutarate dehydrogenase E1 component